jgi:kynureninase
MDFEWGPFRDDPDHQRAIDLDDADDLASHRESFVIPDPDLIYLDGNSLGRLPTATPSLVGDVVSRQWAERLIKSWNDGWWDLQLELGRMLAPLIGAHSEEVIISDSTSVNLYKLAMAALEARPGRTKVITDDLNFPSDAYILAGVAEHHGAHLEILASDGVHGPVDSLLGAIDEETALVSLSHTAFQSGYTYDMALVNRAARRHGALTLWDLSHSAGVMPIDLDADAADLAVGCTYKYLSGGPGSPAFLYVRSDLIGQLRNPIAGWWGHAEPFEFDLDFRPTEGIRRFHTGTMPIISLAAIEPGIRLVGDVGTSAIREKSESLVAFLVHLWERHLLPLGFALGSPREPRHRGSHVSLRHEEGWAITTGMIEIARVLPDFRAPDAIRLGMAPLYTTHQDVHTAVLRMRNLVSSGLHRQFAGRVATVT